MKEGIVVVVFWGPYYTVLVAYNFTYYNLLHCYFTLLFYINTQSGADILKYYDMENSSVSEDCWTLFGYCLAFFLIYYIALVKTTGKR